MKRCALKAGHAGPCRLVARRPLRGITDGVTPSEPLCLQALITRREADVRSGQLVERMRRR
jgi:hypothetical protein